MKLREDLDGLVDFFLPTGCVACRAWIPAWEGAGILCGPCRARLRPASWPRCPRCHHPRGTGRSHGSECLECHEWPEGLRLARFACILRDPADHLVHALKYEGWRELADFMGSAIAGSIRDDATTAPGDSPPTVVPVPTTLSRERARGYNQSGLLAECVARRLEAPVCRALQRAGESRSQTVLTPTERRSNVRGVFGATEEAGAIAGRRVLLIDDVLTTGATASEAAETLLDAGAGEVVVGVFARAIRGRRVA